MPFFVYFILLIDITDECLFENWPDEQLYFAITGTVN